MSLDNIIASILGDAEAAAGNAAEIAGEEAAEIMAKAEKSARTIAEDAKRSAREDAEMTKERKLSIAELDTRKLHLAARQGAVEKCFEAAIERLENMEDEDYIDFLRRKVVEAAGENGIVLFNEEDRKKIGAKVVALANADLGGEKVSLGTESISARGGFILRCGAVEINNTLEVVVDSIKQEILPEVAAALFPGREVSP